MIWTMSRKYKLLLFCVRFICHLPELIWWSMSRVIKKTCQYLPYLPALYPVLLRNVTVTWVMFPPVTGYRDKNLSQVWYGPPHI